MNLVREIDRLSKKLDKVSSEIKQDRIKLTHWRGRKVIPVSEWRSILIFRREEIFDYLPDDFVSGPFAGTFGTDMKFGYRAFWIFCASTSMIKNDQTLKIDVDAALLLHVTRGHG